MPDFFDILEARHSIRAYLKKEVEEEKIRSILQAANSAPSAGGLQAYEIVLVKEAKGRKTLAEAAWGQSFIAEAPVALVFLAHPRRSAGRYGSRGKSLYCLQDATIAAAYAQLAATALDLGSVWVGAFDDQDVREAVGAGQEMIPVAIICLGYAAERAYATSRRSLTDLVHAERLRSP